MTNNSAKQIHRDHFDQELKILLEQKTKSNLFTKEHHDDLIRDYIVANKKPMKLRTLHENRLLNTYDIIRLDGTKRLIKHDSQDRTRIFVHSAELFPILDKAHHELNHAGVRKIFDHLRTKYLNITMESITLYNRTCDFCNTKKQLKEMNTKQFSKWMIRIIDMNSIKIDNDYRYILQYQDIRTKFSIFKPLKMNTAEQIARKLWKIFGCFGAPQILAYYDGRQEFVENVKEKLKEFNDDLKIITGKKEPITNIESENEIKKLLISLCKNQKTDSWSKVIPELQFLMNTTVDDIDGSMTPFEHFFGYEPNFGLEFTLPENFKPEDLVEEKLEKFCQKYLNQSKSNKTTATTLNDSAILSDSSSARSTSSYDSYKESDNDSDDDDKSANENDDDRQQTIPKTTTTTTTTISSVFCTCKTGCQTKKCKCFVSNTLCNQFCHQYRTCLNLVKKDG
ncbi:KRAB-A domain-containing protein 2-like [Dermatophagoides pteronyssinus]|uniref:KRAB-A domain-containing protein 2-like n=1 Tax=Dermatophagoides pteronyssinus TaxID=6956 RepID=UPI003F6694DC